MIVLIFLSDLNHDLNHSKKSKQSLIFDKYIFLYFYLSSFVERYFYLSSFFRGYFYFYLSNFFGDYFYFYLVT